METSVNGASDLIINITGDLGAYDVMIASDYVKELTGDEVNIILGANYDVTEPDTCTVTVIATGIQDMSLPTRQTSTAGVMFGSSLVRPNPIQSFVRPGQGVQPSVSTTQELNVLSNRSTGTMPRVSIPTPGAGASPNVSFPSGITSPGDVRSAVKDTKINIPDFLKNKPN